MKAAIQIAVIVCITLTLAVAAVAGFMVWGAFRTEPSDTADMSSDYMPDRELGFIPRPNRRATSGSSPVVEYITNDRGFRIGSKTSPTQADVLVIGCSQTYGQGVLYDATFAAVIGEKLRLRTANLGVSGYGGISSILLATRFKDLRPSLVVYGFWEDHLYRNIAKCVNSGTPFCVSTPYFLCSQEEECRILRPKDNSKSMMLNKQYAWQVEKMKDSKSFADDVYWTIRLKTEVVLQKIGLSDKYVKVSDYGTLRASTLAFFDLVVQQTANLGSTPIIVFIPYYFDDVIHDTPDYVIEAAHRSGVDLITLTDRFRAEVAVHPGTLAIPGDGHLSEKAHAIIAEVVADYVVKHRILQSESRVQMDKTPPAT